MQWPAIGAVPVLPDSPKAELLLLLILLLLLLLQLVRAAVAGARAGGSWNQLASGHHLRLSSVSRKEGKQKQEQEK